MADYIRGSLNCHTDWCAPMNPGVSQTNVIYASTLRYMCQLLKQGTTCAALIAIFDSLLCNTVVCLQKIITSN